MKKHPFLCWLTLIFFLFSHFPNDLVSAAQLTPSESLESSSKNFDLQGRLVIPNELGIIKKSWKDASNVSQPWVIHIQDLHVDYEAQKNVAAIIKAIHFFLRSQDPAEIEKGLLIAVEGASGKIDPTFFSSFPNAQVRQDTADYFLRKAGFTGPEFFSVLYPDWKLEIFGIEDEAIYLDHKEAYAQCVKSQLNGASWLNTVFRVREELKEKALSKDAITFLERRSGFENGKVNLAAYAKFLTKSIQQKKISSRKTPNLKLLFSFLKSERKMEPDQIERERNQCLKDLSRQLPKEDLNDLVKKSLEYRLGRIEEGDYFRYLDHLIGKEGLKSYPHLSRYIQLVRIKAKLKLDLVLKELKPLEEDLLTAFFKTPSERQFLEFFESVQLIEKLFQLKMNREDLFKLKSKKDHLKGIFERYGLTLPEDFQNFESFYRIAQVRDQVLFEKTNARMKESGRKIAILFTGGFHTEGLTQFFENNNISYTVVTPKAKGFSQTTEDLYRSRMLGNQNAFEEMLLAQIKSLHPGTFLGPLMRDPVLAQQLQEIHRVHFELTAQADAIAVQVPQISALLNERRESLKNLFPEVSDLKFFDREIQVDGVRYVLASKGHEILALRFVAHDSLLNLEEDRFEILESGSIGPYQLQIVSASNLPRIFKIKHPRNRIESTLGKNAIRFLKNYDVNYAWAKRFLRKIPAYKEFELFKTSISFGGATYFVGKRGKKVYFFRFVKGVLEEVPLPERYSVEDSIRIGKLNVQILMPRVFGNLLRRNFLEKDILERFPKDFFEFGGIHPTRPAWTDLAGESSEDLAAAMEVLRYYDVGRVIELAELHGEITEHGAAIYVEAEKGTYVLRPISSNIRSDSVNEARFEISLVQHLVQNGFPAIDIIPSNEVGPSEHPLDKYFVVHSNGKVYLLYDFVEGSVLQGEDLTPEERSAMVKILARLHQLTEKGDFVGIRRLRRINDFRKWKAQLANLRRIIKEKKEKNKAYQYTNAEKFFLNRLPFILDQIAKFQKGLPVRRYDLLPRAIVHGRFRPQNMVFKKGQNGTLPEVIGIFDWVDAREEIRVWDFLNGLFKRSLKIGRQFDIRMLRWVIDEYQKYHSLTETELDAIPEILRAKTLERISSLLLEFTRLPHRLRHDLSGIPDEERALWLLDHEKSIFEMARRYVRLLEDIDRKIEDGSFEALKAMTMKGSTKNPYVNAVRQIMRVAPYVGLTGDQLWELARPKRVVALEFPVMMDDGSIEMFKGYRVHHNDDLGPTKGGIRYHPGVTREEVKALATWMTIKNSIAGLPYGGGKGGVEIEPKKYSKTELARISRAYFRKLSELEAVGPNLDIPAPDVNTSGETMSWMVDEYIQYQVEKGQLNLRVEELEEFESISKEASEKEPLKTLYLDKYIEILEKRPEGEKKAPELGVLTGKPAEPVYKGGSIGRTEATGQGVFYTTRMAVRKILKKESLEGVRVRIQGFGNVGSYTARFLHEAGAKITAVGDDTGSIENLDGIDIEKLLEYAKKNNGKIKGFPFATPISADQLLEGSCDVLIPAALENQITEKNADKIQAQIVVEAANGPTTPEADKLLEKRGISVIPDVLANSGGVTVSYFEWLQNLNGERWTLDRVNRQLQGIMEMNFEEMYRVAVEKKVPYRLAAYVRGVGRVIEKMMVNQLRAPPSGKIKPTAFKTPGAERAPPAALPDPAKTHIILNRLLDRLSSRTLNLSEIPVVPVARFPSEHQDDLAYSELDKSGKIVEIRVREDLGKRIQDDYKAQGILIRHEYIENILIPELVNDGFLEKRDLLNAHYFTSYIDMRMEGTPVHSLMNHVLPLLSDDQLRSIQPFHPNDPQRAFYTAVQVELETRRLMGKARSASIEQAVPEGERQASLFIRQSLLQQNISGEVWTSVKKQILNIISKNQHIRANNRSIVVKLEQPIERFPGDKDPITYLQIKGVLFDAKRPLRPHQGAGVAKTVVFDEEGYLELQEYSGIPQGGSWLKESLQEFLGTLNFQEKSIGFLTKYPFGWGEFPGLSLNGRRLGFVVLGMNDETRLERGIEDITASSLMTYGQMLRRLHDAGFIHQFPHPDNISIEREGLPVFHDLETLLRRQDLNSFQDLGYLYWELRYVLAKLKRLLSDSALTGDGINQLLVNFLRGYFGESHLEFSGFDINQFTDLFEYFNQRYSVEEIRDFNPIFKRLKEASVEKFSPDLSGKLKVAQGDVRIDGAFKTPGTGPIQAQAPPDAVKINIIQERLKPSDYKNIPFEVVDSLAPGHDNDFAHLAEGKILVRRDLWEKIRDDGRAQFILRRHEYVENVLIPLLIDEGPPLQQSDLEQAHALTSAIDAIEEGTPFHSLMQYVISLMSEDELRAIQPYHPNDPNQEFYAAVQKEIRTRFPARASELTEDFLFDPNFPEDAVYDYFKDDEFMKMAQGFESIVFSSDGRYVLKFPYRSKFTHRVARVMKRAADWSWMFLANHGLKRMWVFVKPALQYVFQRWALEKNIKTAEGAQETVSHYELALERLRDLVVPYRILSGKGFEVNAGWLDQGTIDLEGNVILQKGVSPSSFLDAALKDAAEKSDAEEAKKILKKIVDFQIALWRRKLMDWDFGNFGGNFILDRDGVVKMLDIGGLSSNKRDAQMYAKTRGDFAHFIHERLVSGRQPYQIIEEILPIIFLSNRREVWDLGRVLIRLSYIFRMNPKISHEVITEFFRFVSDEFTPENVEFHWEQGIELAESTIDMERLEEQVPRDEIQDVEAFQHTFLRVNEILTPDQLEEVAEKIDETHPELAKSLRGLAREVKSIKVISRKERNKEEKYEVYRAVDQEGRELDLKWPIIRLEVRGPFKVPGTGAVQAQGPPDAVKINIIQERLKPSDYENIPFEVVDSLGPDHGDDFAHLVDGRILVRRDLWDKIKDDPKAQFILRRHEYVENVLISLLIDEGPPLQQSDLEQVHALASAIDAIEEDTSLHALMKHVIPLMSDAQLAEIQLDHPNDPRKEFFLAAERELELRLAKKVSDQSLPIEIFQRERKASFHVNRDLVEDETLRGSVLESIKEIAMVVVTNHEVQANERSMVVKLAKPIPRYPHDDNPITHVQIKGIVFDATQPLVEHEGLGRARGIDFDSQGRIHVRIDGGKPQGGAWLREAISEFLNTNALQQAAWGLKGITPLSGIVQTKYPVAWGEFPDLKLNGRSMGFVVLGLNSKSMGKRAFDRFDSLTFRTYGRVVRKLHEAGFIHTAFHPGNISIIKERLPVIHDLGDVLETKGMSDAQLMGYVYHEVAYIAAQFNHLFGERGDSFVQDFLRGYFGDDRLQVSAKQIEKFREIINQLSRLSIEEVQTRNTVFHKLMEVVEGPLLGRPLEKSKETKKISEKEELESVRTHKRLGQLGKKDLVPLNSSILDILGGEARLKLWFEELGLEYSFADLQGFLNSWRIYFVVSPGMMDDRSAYRLEENLTNRQGEILLEKGDLLLNYGQFDSLLTQAALTAEKTQRHQYYRSAFALLLEAVHSDLHSQNLPSQIQEWKSEDIKGAFKERKLRLITQQMQDTDFDKAVWEVMSGKLKLEKDGKAVGLYDLKPLMRDPDSYRRNARYWLDEGIQNIYWNRLPGTQVLHSLNAFLQGPPRRFSGEFELKVFQNSLGDHLAILKPSLDSLGIEKFYPRDPVLPKGRLFIGDRVDEYFASSA